MTNTTSGSDMPTGMDGLDAIPDGGRPAGRTCLIAGPPGTGKTTLGNQLAFNHAATGGRSARPAPTSSSLMGSGSSRT